MLQKKADQFKGMKIGMWEERAGHKIKYSDHGEINIWEQTSEGKIYL